MQGIDFTQVEFNGTSLVITLTVIMLAMFFLPRFFKSSTYEAGYNYAKEELRTGHKTPYDLEAEAMGFDDRTEFDIGIDAAVDDAVRAGQVKDNRLY